MLAFAHAVREAVTARETGFTDIVDVVPAAATVLVIVNDEAPVIPVRQALSTLPVGASKRCCSASSGLRSLCITTGPISPRSHSAPGSAFGKVIAAPHRNRLAGRVGGFAPGFAYLTWGDPRLAVSRRREPLYLRASRQRGPCRELQCDLSAVITGWVATDRPHGHGRLRCRCRTAHRAATGRSRALRRGVGGESVIAASRALEVLDTGLLALVQDLGRTGLASSGVGRSGAADTSAFRLGARLLAQPYSAAALEITFGGLSFRSRGELQIALTGAPAPATVDEHPVGYFRPRSRWPAVKCSDSAGPPSGCARMSRSAVGSMCRQSLDPGQPTRCQGSGRGRFASGDALPIGPAPATFPNVDVAPTLPLSAEILILHCAARAARRLARPRRRPR